MTGGCRRNSTGELIASTERSAGNGGPKSRFAARSSCRFFLLGMCSLISDDGWKKVKSNPINLYCTLRNQDLKVISMDWIEIEKKEEESMMSKSYKGVIFIYIE
jgi:hypothetical protein